MIEIKNTNWVENNIKKIQKETKRYNEVRIRIFGT